MIKSLHLDDYSVIEESALARLLAHPAVDGYLRTLDAAVPGLDLTVDRAVAEGLMVAADWRDGGFELLDRRRALARLTFDGDEYDALAAAAIAYLTELGGPTR